MPEPGLLAAEGEHQLHGAVEAGREPVGLAALFLVAGVGNAVPDLARQTPVRADHHDAAPVAMETDAGRVLGLVGAGREHVHELRLAAPVLDAGAEEDLRVVVRAVNPVTPEADAPRGRRELPLFRPDRGVRAGLVGLARE